MFRTGNGHRILLHRFQQRRLRLGRCPVDFIGKDDISENRAFDEFEIAVLIERFRAKNIGRHQIGRELDPVEIQVERRSNGLDQKRFREPRNPYQ
ncbi:hypothetical protein D3C87_1734900 [compost metagenome]